MYAIFNFKDFYKRKFTCREFVFQFSWSKTSRREEGLMWRIGIECIEQFSLNLNIESFLVGENFQAPFAVVESHIASSNLFMEIVKLWVELIDLCCVVAAAIRDFLSHNLFHRSFVRCQAFLACGVFNVIVHLREQEIRIVKSLRINSDSTNWKLSRSLRWIVANDVHGSAFMLWWLRDLNSTSSQHSCQKSRIENTYNLFHGNCSNTDERILEVWADLRVEKCISKL